MKKINLFLLFVLSFTIYAQPNLKNNFYDTRLNIKGGAVNSSTLSDTTKSNWDVSFGFDTYYFFPMLATEFSSNLTEENYLSIQLSSAFLILNDLGIRNIYRSSQSPGIYYGGGMHGILDILAGAGLFFGGIVGYEGTIFKSTRIGGEIRPGIMFSKEEGIDVNGAPWIMFGARIRW